MEQITIRRAEELGEAIRPRISDIFVDGFGQWLEYFSKDRRKLSQALAHMFLLDQFYVGCVDGQVAGMVACTDGIHHCVRLDAKECRKHLGFVRGSIMAHVLKGQFENRPYPFPVTPNMGSVEFVATDSAYRGKGVAQAIIRQILALPQYDQFVLEVADTNGAAVQLYEKLGFREFTRVEEKHSKRTGFDYLVYMKYQKPTQQG